MEWITNFLNRTIDQQEKLSPAEREETERKIRTQKRAEQRRKDLERANKISLEAEKFRLPGGKGSDVPDFREWLKDKCYEKYQSIPEPFEKAMKSGDPKDLPLLGWSRKLWEYQESKRYPSDLGLSTKKDAESDNSGYVYVIQDLDSGLFKIGYTKNPDRRFNELGVGLTAQEISCDYFDNAREIEKKAHKKYADSRLPQSEYFKLYKPPIIDMD